VGQIRTATADSPDVAFWLTLKALSIDSNFPSEDQAVFLAESRCVGMQNGELTPTGEIEDLATPNGGEGIYGLTFEQAGEFLGAAMKSYCPILGPSMD
jgi:hypothetical protein